MTPSYLNKAHLPSFHHCGTSVRCQRIAELVVISGELVACDPLVCPEALPFTVKIPRGRYTVDLGIAEFGNDQRVAFALLPLSANQPMSWELLTVKGQDIASLADDQFFGYGVDSGTGCFMDREARDGLLARMGQESDYYEHLIAEMEKTYRHTWSWLNAPFGSANLVGFSTGYGDGAYPTFAGYDSKGILSAIVTDFGVLDDQEP